MNTTATLPPPSHVVLDACVLMPGILRRLWLRLAGMGLYEPIWSEYIGDEWRRNAARIWSIPAERLQQEWQDMQTAFPAACAGNLQEWKAGLRYSDPKDWHVIAAARDAQARSPEASIAIATWNLRDFNRSELRRLGLQAVSPDTLLARFWHAAPSALLAALEGMAQDASDLGGTPEPIADALRREHLFLLRQLFWAQAQRQQTTGAEPLSSSLTPTTS